MSESDNGVVHALNRAYTTLIAELREVPATAVHMGKAGEPYGAAWHVLRDLRGEA